MSSTPTSAGMPRQIGPYRVEREIARGGMGIVYLAHDTRLDRAVAIKALPDDVAADPDRLARFEREAKTLASLNHPNIAGIYGIEESGGRLYLALEHIEGETLAARIARGPLPLAETLDICVQIAAGLEAAHESGVIHRDLKPGNVMITPGDHVKVLDFGLAKGKVTDESGVLRPAPLADSPTLSSPTLSSPALPHSPTIHGPATLPGVILGTAAYLSPEQARGKAVDRRTDIWSFGCVLYECLTGKRAFEGETVSDTIAKILVQDVDWPRLPKSAPPRVRELLKRCLEKDPRKRLRDIGEARLALEGVRAGAAGGLDTAEPAPTGTVARVRDAFHNNGFLFAVGLILGALLGLNMWGSLGSHGARGVRDVMRVSVPIPPELHAFEAQLTPDGRAEILRASPRSTAGAGESRPLLYLRRLDKTEFEPIRGTEGVTHSGLSPDGRWMWFRAPLSERSFQYRLLKAPTDGSAPPTPLMSWDDAWFGGPIWLHSGDLAVMRNHGKEFVRLLGKGGPSSKPVAITGPKFVGDAQFIGLPLPGDHGAFALIRSYEGGAYHEGVSVVDLKTGAMKPLLRDGANARITPTGHLLFTRGAVLYAAPFDPRKLEIRGEAVAVMDGLRTPTWLNSSFNLSENGILQTESGGSAWWSSRRAVIADSKGTVAEWSPDRQAFEVTVAVAPDGTRFAGVIADPSTALYEIWISERGRPSSRRAVAEPGADLLLPVWSPDGTRLAYSRQTKSTGDGIYIADLNGSSPPRQIAALPDPSVPLGPSSWSPDGRQLLCVSGQGDQVRMLLVPASPPGGTPAEPKRLFSGPAHRGGGKFSPDGKWITYRSDETGRFEIYVSAWSPNGPTGEPLQVSAGNAGRMRWSADGKRVCYQTPNGKIMAVAISTSPRLSASAPSVAWDLNALRVADILWDILPDGRLLAIQRAPGEDEVTRYDLTLNFFEELKQRFANASRKSR